METAIVRKGEELLTYDENSLEYRQISVNIEIAEKIEKDIETTVKRLLTLWKKHPFNDNQILSVSVDVDGYYNFFALDGEDSFIVNKVHIGKREENGDN